MRSDRSLQNASIAECVENKLCSIDAGENEHNQTFFKLKLVRTFKILIYFRFKFCTNAKVQVLLDEKINDDLEKEIYKPKSQPGRTTIKNIELPESIVDAIKTCVKGKQTTTSDTLIEINFLSCF